MSGSTIGGAIGAVVGFWVTGGNPQGAQWGWMIGSAIGGAVDPEKIRGPSIGDAQKQGTYAGWPIPVVFGHPAPQSVCLIDGDPISRKYTKTEQQGKGGPEVTTEHFHATRAFLVCEGEAHVLRIRRNGKLVYSQVAGDYIDAESASFASSLRIYNGSQTQVADPSLEALHGVGNTPYYRGRCYFVVIDDDETHSQGAPNQYSVEVASCGTVVTGGSGEDDRPVWFTAPGIGDDENVYSSTNGTAWGTEQATGLGLTCEAMFSANGRLYALRSGAGRVSADGGQTWGSCTGLTNATTPHGMVFCGGRYITTWNVGGIAGDKLLISTDGLAFSEVAVEARTYYGAAAIGDTVVIMSTVGRCIRSTDGGVTWSAAFLTGVSTAPQITASASAFVAAGISFVARSTDGLAWSIVHSPTGDVAGLAYGAGRFVVLEDDGATAYSDDDGLTWAAGGSIAGFSSEANSHIHLAYGGGLFVAVGSNQRIYTSASGVTWTERSISGSPPQFHSVAYVAPTTDGIELPDAPGYYVQTTGEIVGPARDTITACVPELREIIEAICARVPQFPLDRLDIDNLTQPVPGYRLARTDLAATDYLRDVIAPYFVDLPEFDDQIHGVIRGGSLVATLTEDDCVESDEEDDTRNQQVEYPSQVKLFYPDPANKYTMTPQIAARESPDIATSRVLNMETQIPFDADTAAQIVDISQKLAFARVEGKIKRTLPSEFTRLTNADPISFEGRRYLIDRTERGDGVLTIEALYDRDSAYTSIATGHSGITPTSPTTGLRGPTIFSAMNLPRLRTSDNSPGMYLAVTGLLPNWAGADIYLSVDNGVSEQLVTSLTRASVMGTLVAGIDEDDEPILVLPYGDGELETITAEQLANRQNGFAITTSGVSEVGQFQTAELDLTGAHYEVTDIVRGAMGTTATTHDAGDVFVLLDTIAFLPIDIQHAGKTLIFRAATRGTPVANNPTFSVVYMPQFTGPAPEPDYYTDAADERYTDASGAYYYRET